MSISIGLAPICMGASAGLLVGGPAVSFVAGAVIAILDWVVTFLLPPIER